MKSISFQMWEDNRQYIITEHRFHVTEGRERLTNQFSSSDQLEKDANAYCDALLEGKNKSFNPDRDDEGSICDEIYHEGIQHYFDLEELGNLARLSLIAGIYHRWEKDLKNWMTSNYGIGSFPGRNNLIKKIQKSNFKQLLELFKYENLFQDGCKIKEKLDICRMVVNTYKHGSGESEDNLKVKRPDLFSQDFVKSMKLYDLFVKDKHIEEFASAIENFWKVVPKSFSLPETPTQPIPSWLKKARADDPW